ncbi:uncharacterized protein LOC133196604, partial [Saccostrea echinata]|uniref:uncharacterized protein LOC133196604 n=1 Tax=Saccostrea echinata TaxID=191078 RepID=UPI002A7FC5B6
KAKHPDCPFCDKAIDEPRQDHVILCSGQRFKCMTYGAKFKKNSYLVKHMKVHNAPPLLRIGGDNPEETPISDHVGKESNQSDWEFQDPGEPALNVHSIKTISTKWENGVIKIIKRKKSIDLN